MPDQPKPRENLPATSRREIFGLGVIFACVVWFYAYIGIPPAYPVRFQKEDSEYYNLLTDSFLSGRLDLKLDPPPALLALSDPYDPAQRAGIAGVLHDAVFFKGRYYLYFGVAPALTLFVPFRLLTGYFFPQNLATVIFCAAGYGCSLGLLLALRRRFFPATSAPWVWLTAVLLGLGNFCAPLLARNSVWEVPIACAYFYTSLGLWLLLLGWNPPRHRGRWLWLASAALGLAVASRPHFVFFPAGLGVLWLWYRRNELRRDGRWNFRLLGPEFTALFLPLAVIIGGLLTYNCLRFGRPFEFGIRYQLGGYSVVNATLTSGKFFPINFYYEFLAPAQLQRYFPFFNMVNGYHGTRPADWGGAEDPYGVLGSMPFSWVALVTPLLWFACFRSRREVGAWLLILGWGFLSVALPVLCFGGACNRYEVDFLPPLLLVAALGMLMMGSLAKAIGSRIAWAGMLGMVAYTALLNAGVALQHNDKFQIYRPETYARLAEWFNRPATWWEQRHAGDFGPVELTVRFPRDQLGQSEPLLVSGVSYKSDFVYVLYNSGQVRLAFTHTNGRQSISPPITVDYAVAHRIGIAAGSLYPAATHPFFSGWPTAEVTAAKRTLNVTLDGVPYLTLESDCYDTSPGFVSFGENKVSDYIGRKFTGEILEVKRQKMAPAVTAFNGGSFLRLGLVFPAVKLGRREPLVSTGATGGKGDMLFVQYVGEELMRLGFQHDGAEPLLSPPIAIHSGEMQVLEVSLGSFYSNPQTARAQELSHLLVARINGQTVWILPQAFHPLGAQSPLIGRNAGEAPGYEATFTGRVVAQQPVELFASAPASPFAVPPYWLETDGHPDYGALRLHLALPAMSGPRIEPLVVSGAAMSVADYVTINYLAPTQLAMGFLHAGVAPLQSARQTIDPGRVQVVEIELPSFYPSENDRFFATRSVPEITALKKRGIGIRFNGRLVLQSTSASYESTPEQVSVGVDRLGKAQGARFTGRILAIERLNLEPPAGLAEKTGPLELTFVFPETPARGAETLLTTGDGKATDALLVVYDDAGQAHLAMQTAGGPSLVSPAMPLDSSRHTLRLEWGGLYPGESAPVGVSPDEWLRLQHGVMVVLDGKPLLKGQADFVRGQPQVLTLGNASAAGAAFSGRLQSVKRLSAEKR